MFAFKSNTKMIRKNYYFKSIKYIYQYQSLTSLPNELSNLISLTIHDISGCINLTSLSNELSNLTSLAIIDMSLCLKLILLPKEM